MTNSYTRSQLRKYRATHPWARTLPKQKKYEDLIDLGIIEPFDHSAEDEARKVGDGSWAVVYDENRKGKWLWELADNGWADHICSECRYTINTDIHVSISYDRCPCCGAYMRKE